MDTSPPDVLPTHPTPSQQTNTPLTNQQTDTSIFIAAPPDILPTNQQTYTDQQTNQTTNNAILDICYQVRKMLVENGIEQLSMEFPIIESKRGGVIRGMFTLLFSSLLLSSPLCSSFPLYTTLPSSFYHSLSTPNKLIVFQTITTWDMQT